eukprot:CAMPEP_0194130284 /NCGR_PEP_ID=MMETSP0152-20130528/1354_1 /TAXON_ID=1049557 /ORGANISM="Thalassiothrix antarctica, Strain L6-D1" /LENGTH=340 /DNA_ID=CAMNT_0038824753 /DNA_START=134 /DNA_END=1156 /DNA_ORIENTATION=-
MQETDYFISRIEHGSARKKAQMAKMKELSKRKKMKNEMKQQQLSLVVLKEDMDEQQSSLQMVKHSMGMITPSPSPSTRIDYAAARREIEETSGWLVVKEDQTSPSSSNIVESETEDVVNAGMEQQTQLLQKILSKFDQMESKIDNMQSKFDRLERNQDDMKSVLGNLQEEIKDIEDIESIESTDSFYSKTNLANDLIDFGDSATWIGGINGCDAIVSINNVSPLSKISHHILPEFPKTLPKSMSQLLLEHEIIYKLNEYQSQSSRKNWSPALKAHYSRRSYMYSLILKLAGNMRGKSSDFTSAKTRAAETMDKEMLSKGMFNTEQYYKHMKKTESMAKKQ